MNILIDLATMVLLVIAAVTSLILSLSLFYLVCLELLAAVKAKGGL